MIRKEEDEEMEQRSRLVARVEMCVLVCAWATHHDSTTVCPKQTKENNEMETQEGDLQTEPGRRERKGRGIKESGNVKSIHPLPTVKGNIIYQNQVLIKTFKNCS